jgi:hypothetical protein
MEDGGRGGAKIRHADIRPDSPLGQLLLHPAFMPCFRDQHREEAKQCSRLYIQETVADDRARRKIDGPVLRRPKEEGRAGLAAIALLFGRVRAVVERIHRSPIRSELFVEPVVDAMDGLLCEKSSSDSRLIRHANDEVPMLSKKTKRVADAARDFCTVGISEVLQIGHHGPIAVQEDGAATQSGPSEWRAHDWVGVGELLTVLHEGGVPWT